MAKKKRHCGRKRGEGTEWGGKRSGDAGWEKEEKKLWKEKRENFDTENIFPVVMMLYDEHIDFCTSFYHFII